MASYSVVLKRLSDGTTTELLRYPSAAALLLDYDEGETVRLLGLGLFFVNVIVQTVVSPVLVAVCSVNGFQWPLTKDTPIIRSGRRTFIFGLPGLLYALQFPMACEPTLILNLVKVFMKYGHYKDLGDYSPNGEYLRADNDPLLWKTIRPPVQSKAHEILCRFGQQAGKSRFSVLHHNGCYTRAARMSATTKTIANALSSSTLRGAHITIEGSDPSRNPASPSICVFTCLVDAIEVAWMISCGMVPLMVNPLPHSYPYPGFRVWRLNEMGLLNFIKGLESVAKLEEEMVSVRTGVRSDSEGKKKGEASDSSVGKGKGKKVVDKGKRKQVKP